MTGLTRALRGGAEAFLATLTSAITIDPGWRWRHSLIISVWSGVGYLVLQLRLWLRQGLDPSTPTPDPAGGKHHTPDL